MINHLKDATFIIPIRLDSEERGRNVKISIDYLLKNLETNIVVFESDTYSKFGELGIKGDRLHEYWFEETRPETPFHKTRFLNEVVNKAKTDVVVFYDADILLPVSSYVHAYNRIKNRESDFVFPYGWGNFQREIYVRHKDKIDGDTDLDNLSPDWYRDSMPSEYGHVLFLNRRSFIDGFMDNEAIVMGGPEDKERIIRFKKLGYKVDWLHNSFVYHLEHPRQDYQSTSLDNETSKQNYIEYIKICQMEKGEIESYYKNQPYLKKYSCTSPI
jgi:hypothetical protein